MPDSFVSSPSSMSVRTTFLDAVGVQPDPFQLQAMAALDRDKSVLVMAPTGAGKTLIADYAVAQAVAAGTTAVYTTPLKALSNQKHRDLTDRLGKDRVGLITGDRTLNPTAPVLVMTTEVLRAMLYDKAGAGRAAADGPRPLRNLGVVVLDEFHYLQDDERGAAWEEVVIHAPAAVRLVCLSATIPDVEVVHAWLDAVHGPAELVVAADRPVRLNHLYAVGNLRRAAPMLLPMYVDGRVNTTAELLDGARRDTRGEGLRARDRDRPVPPARADLIACLHGNDLVPAIWFVLSRAGCDEAVSSYLADGVQLTSESERVRVRGLISQALAPLSGGELRAIDAQVWQDALEAGIAAHHGGLAPVQREVVEAAFAEGLVKVAFATETLALGVNLPARTVVVDRVVRASGELLSAGEFAQLSGRAGRRGIDETGHVIVPWSPHVPFHRVAALAGGHLATIRSAFRVTPAMAANLVRTCAVEEARQVVESSLRHWRNLEQAAIHRTDLAARQADLAQLGPEVPDDRVELAAGGADAVAPDPHRDRAAAALAGVRPGDVLLDSGRPSDGPVVVLAVRTKRNAPCVEVIRTNGRRTQVTPWSLRGLPRVVARLDLPAWVPTRRGHAERAANALAQLDLPALRAGVEPSSSPAPTPRQTSRAASQVVRRELTESIASLRSVVSETEKGVRSELAKVVELLERRGHVRLERRDHVLPERRDQVVNWTLTASGEAVRRLFHPSGLLLAECLVSGTLDGLDAQSLASAASWFTVRTRLGAPPSTGIASSDLAERWEAVRAATRDLQADEASLGLPLTAHPEPALGVPLHRWASGAPLDAALAGTGALVGDVVREIRQVAELLEQLATVPGAHQPTAEQAIRQLRRGTLVTGGGDQVEPSTGLGT